MTISDHEEQPETIAGPCDDATDIVPPPTEAAPDLAWSQDAELDEVRLGSWRTVVVAASMVLVLSGAAAALILTWRHEHHAVSGRTTTPVATTPAAGTALPRAGTIPPPVFDGTYRIDFDYGQATFRGNAMPRSDRGIHTSWWAFRSSCTPSGCTARGVKLDSTHAHIPPPGDAAPSASTLDFVNGRWQNTSTFTTTQPCDTNNRAETFSMSWTFEPSPDGTLHGREVNTITTNECGYQGNVVEIPFIATRMASVPAGVLSGTDSP